MTSPRKNDKLLPARSLLNLGDAGDDDFAITFASERIVLRTLGNLRRIGVKEYLHQMLYIGDTKAGVLVGQDRFGNKFYENLEEELPLRTRWVDYKVYELDASQIDPGWHAWISYMVDKPPSEDTNLQFGRRPWDSKEAKPNHTQSWGAYRPYSTTKPKYHSWVPVAKARSATSA
ncbi:hypothetical protein DV737_g136, partial [Chaetothyriales sp. CBS 132003]